MGLNKINFDIIIKSKIEKNERNILKNNIATS